MKEPIFLDSVLFVQGSFDLQVFGRCGRRKDFDNKIRCAEAAAFIKFVPVADD
jgi:hypothetical protein